MTVTADVLVDKVTAVLEPVGFAEQVTVMELTGNTTWALWDEVRQVETIVSLYTDGAPYVVVVFEDADHKRISSSGKFYVGADNVWVYFENTLKLAVKGF